MHAKTYVKYFAFVNFGLVLFVLLGNIFIDPQGFLNLPRVENINKYIVKNNDLGRINNSIKVKDKDFDVILVGTSRVQSGMDTQTKVYKDKKSYNAALGDSSITEMILELEYILANRETLDELVLGLSFHAFSTNRNIHPDYYDSLFNKDNSYVSIMSNYYLSYTAISDSVSTIKSNWNKVPIQYWTDGFYRSGNHNRSRHRVEFIINHYLSEKSLFGCFTYDRNRMFLLQKTLQKFVDKGTKISLFISPQHAKSMLIIDKLDLFVTYNEWMKDITVMVETINSVKGSNLVLWDFSGFNIINNETIPLHENTVMQYYFESSHYTPVLGEIILETMKENKNVIGGFGHILTTKNFTSQIDKMAKGLKNYKQDNPNEVNDFEHIFLQSQTEREKFGCYEK